MKRMLVDVSSLAHRYAATFDEFQVVDRLLDQMYYVKKRFDVAELILAFDGKHAKAWRQSFYPTYGTGRDHDKSVKRRIREFYEKAINHFHCEVIPGYEADDVVATLLRYIESRDEQAQTIIYSRDQDFHALLSEKVWQLLVCIKDDPTMREFRDGSKKREDPLQTMTVNKLFAKFGLRPEQWVDYRMFVGDSSDKVSGLPGFGPKYALDVMKFAGSVENALKLWNKLPVRKGLQELLVQSHENGDLDLLRKVITMRTDAPIEYNLAKLEDLNAFDFESDPDSVLRDELFEQSFGISVRPEAGTSGEDNPAAG